MTPTALYHKSYNALQFAPVSFLLPASLNTGRKPAPLIELSLPRRLHDTVQSAPTSLPFTPAAAPHAEFWRKPTPLTKRDLPLESYNTIQSTPSSFPFVLAAPPNTDLWLKPAPLGAPPATPPIISNSQPTFYSRIRLADFVRSKATVSFDAEYLYDQAGLIILFPRDHSKWVKGGLEYVDGKASRSVVVTTGNGRGAEWSVAPPLASDAEQKNVKSTVEFEREDEGKGTSLLIKIGGEVVREVTWAFASSQDPEEEMWVGFYACRPNPTSEDIGDLQVLVEGWELSLQQNPH